MINLLPPAEKHRIQKEYKLRFFTVNAFLISAAFIIGIILLLPSYFFADIIQKNAESEILTLKNSYENTKSEEINNKLRVTKERLTAITKQESRTDFYKVIDIIAVHANNTIEITTISYIRADEDGDSNLQLNGFAKTRDDLVSFKEDLENDKLFNEVNLPVSSLAEDKDIEFNIQIKGMF